MYNKIVLVGNLTRDIELHYAKSGAGIAKTAIATTRKYTANGERKEEVCFVDITFFGRSAEIANQYLRKGSKCLIDGRLNFEQWTDQNGQKRSKHSVTVETMQMLDSKADGQGGGGYNTPAQDSSTGGMAPSFGGSESYNNSPAAQPNNYSQPAPQQQQQQAQPSYGNAQQQSGNYQQPQQREAKPSYEAQQSIPEYDIDDDEIPF